MNPSLGELWKNLSQLAVTHERLAPDDRDMQWAMAVDKRHEAADKLVALVVGEASKRDIAAQVIIAVRVASRTTKGALSCDLDRDVRAIAREDPAPRLDDFATANPVFAHVDDYYGSVIL
jgi:hypothetical protein